jgi:hypothetical protein
MNRKTVKIMGAAFITCCLFLASCEAGLLKPPEPKDGGGKAALRVSIQDTQNTGERSVLPVYSGTDITSYQLWGSVSGEETLLDSISPPGSEVFLEEGTWNFTLKAFKGTDEILEDTISEFRVPTDGSSISFSLNPIKRGTGSVDITITWPSDSDVARAVPYREDAEETGIDAGDSNSIRYVENNVSFGEYFTCIKLYDKSGGLAVTVSEIVVIRDNLTSSKTIELQEEDFINYGASSEVVPTPPPSTELQYDTPIYDTLSAGQTAYYRFSASAGSTYTVMWFDCDNIENYTDIKVGIKYEGATGYLVEVNDIGNSGITTNTHQVVADHDGYIIVEVQGYSSDNTGTYGVQYWQ